MEFSARTQTQRLMTLNPKTRMSHANQASAVVCNGETIAALRKSLGWTQAVLAEKSGFTERLIRKAESGNSLRRSSLIVIAQTLTEGLGHEIVFEDLVNDPVAKARAFIVAMYLEKHNVVRATKRFIDEDILAHFAGDPRIFPFAGSHQGIQEFENALRTFFDFLEPTQDLSEVENYQFIPTATGALVWGTTWTSPRGSTLKTPIKQALRMDFAKGRMVLFDNRFDTYEIAKRLANPKNRSS